MSAAVRAGIRSSSHAGVPSWSGVDASPEFVELARAAADAEGLSADFEVLDVRELASVDAYDAAICLCQGGFGLLGGRDEVDVFRRIVRAVKPGGAVAVSAFHAPFALRFLEQGEDFDPATGVLHERATVRNEAGEEREFDLWTTCFTARELELLAELAGVGVDGVYGVTPGRYRADAPALTCPELLVVGRRDGERPRRRRRAVGRRPAPPCSLTGRFSPESRVVRAGFQNAGRRRSHEEQCCRSRT